MKKLLFTTLALTAAGLLFTGCQTTPSVRRVETGGTESITTMGLDMADLMSAAMQVTRELIVHDSIAGFVAKNGRKARLDVGAIINSTGQRINIDQVSERVTEELLNSGQITLVAHDAGAKAANTLDNFMSDAKVPVMKDQADYYLEGTLTKQVAREGRLVENTYTFMLRLNNRERDQVWKRSVDITKMGNASNQRGGWSVY